MLFTPYESSYHLNFNFITIIINMINITTSTGTKQYNSKEPLLFNSVGNLFLVTLLNFSVKTLKLVFFLGSFDFGILRASNLGNS